MIKNRILAHNVFFSVVYLSVWQIAEKDGCLQQCLFTSSSSYYWKDLGTVYCVQTDLQFGPWIWSLKLFKHTTYKTYGDKQTG